MRNPVPADHVLPNSLYLSSKPSWWGSVAWPPIGPDVTGGNITGVGGYANLTPSANCYYNVMGGPADGSGNALIFNANNCYASFTGDTTPPSAPSGVAVL